MSTRSSIVAILAASTLAIALAARRPADTDKQDAATPAVTTPSAEGGRGRWTSAVARCSSAARAPARPR